MSTRGIVPRAHNEGRIGKALKRWFEGHFQNLYADVVQGLSLKIGDGTPGDKQITANTDAVSKPFLKYNDTTKRWQFSNDGSTPVDIGAGGGSSAPGIPSYIAYGREITPSAGLQVNIAAGQDYNNGVTVNLSTGTLSLSPRMAAIIYDKKDGTTGKVEAQLPEIDTSLILRYDFTTWDGVSNIPNSAVGVNGNTLAVANDGVLTNPTPGTSLKRVDGFVGYAIQGDGATGYITSQNSTGFPGVSQEKEIEFAITATKVLTGTKFIVCFGGSATTMLIIYTIGMDLYISDGNTAVDTGFDLTVDRNYSIAMTGTTANVYNIYVDESLVFTTTYFTGLTVGAMVLFRSKFGATYFSDIVLHYVDFRNKIRTTQQRAQALNKLLTPCRYTRALAEYPTISASDLATAYHEYHFDETNGSTVGDHAGTLNGVATGTTIVGSEIGLARARRFNAIAGDYISFGNYQFPAEYTVLIGGKFSSTGGVQTFLTNYTGTGGQGNLIGMGADFTLQISTGTNTAISTGKIPMEKTTLVGMVFKNGFASFTIDSGNFDSVLPYTQGTGTYALYAGKRFDNNANYTKGTMEYLVIIPRALNQAEIAQYYASFMRTQESDIREVLPADDCVSLGKVITTSTLVKDISMYYGLGRREKAFGGNRIYDTNDFGWVYVGLNQDKSFPNPFGSLNVRGQVYYKKNLTDSHVTPISAFYSSGYGANIKDITPSKIVVHTGDTFIVIAGVGYTGASETTGYISIVAEVIE